MSVHLTVPTVSRKNIFLDFLSPENHTIYGTNRNLGVAKRIQLLSESLNVAVLLSGDYCFLPPFFALQSETVREVLSLKSDFLTTGVVRTPIRESSLTDFFEKKISEYGAMRPEYPGLFDRQAQLFVERFAPSIIKRHASVGRHIAARWEAGPDVARVWRPLVDELTPNEIESLRSVPHILKESGEAVTWLGMQRHLSSGIKRAHFEINQALHHEYALIYLEEYEATIIAGAPPKTTDLLLVAPDLSYDYWSFRGVLFALGLWDSIRTIDAGSILQLKFGGGFLDFISLFEVVCKSAASRLGVVHEFARLYRDLRRVKPQQAKRISHLKGLILSRQTINAVEILNEFFFEITSLGYSKVKAFANEFDIARLKEQFHPESESNQMPSEYDKDGFSVFICYAHVDNEDSNRSKRWLDRLLVHLKPLVMQNLVTTWSDKQIETGERWHETIQSKLQHAKVAVLLVSESFMASTYIRNSELPVLLKKAKDKGVTILPIIVRRSLFSETKFRFPDPVNGPDELSLSVFQAANSVDKPLNSMEEHEQDRVLLSIAQKILGLVQPNP